MMLWALRHALPACYICVRGTVSVILLEIRSAHSLSKSGEQFTP